MTQLLFDMQTALIQASAAFYGGENVRLINDFPLLAAVCDALRGVCEALAPLTPTNEATYLLREGTLSALTMQYQAGAAVIVDDRLTALQFNGVALDLELVRFYLFGNEIAVASKV